MDPCTIETGLLRKKPCGHPSVTHCDNCERPLCAQHAVAQHTEGGQKTGKFLCKECEAAWREIAKNPPPAPPKKPAEKHPEKGAAAPAKPPAATPAKPPAATPAKPPAATPAKPPAQ